MLLRIASLTGMLCLSVACQCPPTWLAPALQAQRPRLRRWLDSFGEAYSKGVMAATAASLVVLPLCGVPWLSTAAQRGVFYRAMGLLTTASPCALVLVPLAYTAAVGAITARWAALDLTGMLV